MWSAVRTIMAELLPVVCDTQLAILIVFAIVCWRPRRGRGNGKANIKAINPQNGSPHPRDGH